YVSAARRGGLSPRRRQQISRGVQYAILVIVAAVLAALADWPAIAQAFFNLDVAAESFPDLFTVALKNTVIYTLAGFVVGFALGLVLALMRLSSVAPYRWIAVVYIEVFRGLPALLIFLMIGSLPLAFPDFYLPGGVYGMATLGLGVISAAYMAETFRAGLQAGPRGQMEAARTRGGPYMRSGVSVITPRALRSVIPPRTNNLRALVVVPAA